MVQCMSNSKVYKTEDFNLHNKTYGILGFLAQSLFQGVQHRMVLVVIFFYFF